MTVRRHTDPINIKRIWNAIRQANHQKVSPDLARITKYLQSIFNYSPTQVELHLKQALDDKLIAPVKSTNPNQTYKVPLQDELTATDGKDWYCFECHLAGDVIECQTCFRVFHQGCLMGAGKKFEHHKNMMNFNSENISKPTTTHEALTIVEDVVNTCNNSTESNQIGTSTSTSNSLNTVDKKRLLFDEKLCSICNIKRVDTTEDMDKSDINYLLKFVLRRIRAWLPIAITDTLAAEDTPDWLSELEITWRANQLFCEHTDMSVIEVKLNTETYITFTEFLADALTIHHNVAIFHGIESQEYGAAEFMVRDALHDISEIRNCVDCYKHSNEKLIPKWFCLPCRVPHELVWAKQKGYPFWPAKVIRITDAHYDVRFFGGKYERSLLQKMFVRPIDTPKDTLMIKPSTAFTRAYDELKFHQKLLKNSNEVEKLLSESKSKRKSLPKNALKPAINKLPPKSPIKTPNNKIEKKNKPAIPQPNDSQEAGVSSSPSSVGKRQSDDCITLEVDDKRRKLSTDNVANSTYSGTNVIDISDGEEEDDSEEYSFRQNDTLNLEESYEQVTSSTENYGKFVSPRSESGMQPLDQPYSDSVEKMRRTLERLPNKKEIIKCAMDCMQTEIDKIMNDHNEHLKRLFESHNQQISETKKKQWCYNCEQDAIYHCCWNTAYCSQTCQQQHWQAEHKKVCRRKR
ncbi:unnamed protein product [Phyllotreta striolata]|uniref:Zinc finger MYND domain-containing protein 11 n=1 Tax=Phyllotreta striolata TaxID=444603 RepID=A0A9N9T9A0_PHYSR|nr:unnamed protein product [Phyllotreta striolata]